MVNHLLFNSLDVLMRNSPKKRNYQRNRWEVPIILMKNKTKKFIKSKKPLIKVDLAGYLKNNSFMLKNRVSAFLESQKIIINLSSFLVGNFINLSQHDAQKNFGQDNSSDNIITIFCRVNRIKNTFNEELSLIARYYFPGKSRFPFRFRIYSLNISTNSTKKVQVIEMRINRKALNSEKNIKNLLDFLGKQENSVKTFNQKLSNCTVNWKRYDFNPTTIKKQTVLHGFIAGGGCTVFSEQSFEFIHVKDELSLGPHFFWVNDKAFTDKGALIYGDPDDISFQLDRLFLCDFLDWMKNTKFKKNL